MQEALEIEKPKRKRGGNPQVLVAMSPEMRRAVEKIVKVEKHDTMSAYLRTLIRQDIQRYAAEQRKAKKA